MARILVVDDEPDLLLMLEMMLGRAGYATSTARWGEEALKQAVAEDVDLMILDLGLPDVDGTEVVRRLRETSQIPVIILSGHDSESGKVAALDAGADDYVTKPFGMEELLARVRASLRRSASSAAAPATLSFGEIEVDSSRRLVRRAGQFLHLTPTEYDLLEAMATNAGRLLTHTWLLNKVWGPGSEEESQYLRVYVGQLRAKLGDRAEDPRYIATETGVGYRWLPEPDHS